MINQISQTEAREALVDYVSENSCWGSKPALQMEIDQIVTTPVYRYELDSFVEKRQTFLTSKPYEGGEVDGPRSGIAQQHKVCIIPVTEVHYTWKGKKGKYYICGTGRDRKVHAPDYPRKRCGGCC